MSPLEGQESQLDSLSPREPVSLEELLRPEVSDPNVDVAATQGDNNLDHSYHQETDINIDDTDTAGSESNDSRPQSAQFVLRETQFDDKQIDTQPVKSFDLSHNTIKDMEHVINASELTDQMVATADWLGCTPISRPAQACLDCSTDFQFAPAPSTKMNMNRPIPGSNSSSQPRQQIALDNAIIQDAACVATKQNDPILLSSNSFQSVTTSEHFIGHMKILQQHKDVTSQARELASKARQAVVSETEEHIESHTNASRERIAGNSFITRRPFEHLLKTPTKVKTTIRSSMLPDALGHRNFAESGPCSPVQLKSNTQEGSINESPALLRNPVRPGRQYAQSKPFPDIQFSSIEVPTRVSSETPSRPFIGIRGHKTPPHKQISTLRVENQMIRECLAKGYPSTIPATNCDLAVDSNTDLISANTNTCKFKHQPVRNLVSEPAKTVQMRGNDVEIVANVELRNSVPIEGASFRRENRSPRRQVPATRPMPAEDLQTMTAAQSRSMRAQHSPKVVKASQNKQSGVNVGRSTAVSRLKPLGGRKVGRAPSALDLFTAIFDRFELEQEQSEQNSQVIETQETQIQNLTRDNVQLEQHSIALSSMNKELKDRFESLQSQADEYGEYVDRFAKGQKYLERERQKMQNEVDSVKADAAAKADAAVEKIRKMDVSFSRKSRATMEEARLKMDQQEITIELLRKDIESRLNDLQREKGVADRLQKQLDDRLKFEDVIKLLMVEHRSTIMAQLSGQDELISKLTVAEDENQKKFTDCLALVNDIKDASPQVHADLENLSSKIESLSACVMTQAESDASNKAKLRNTENDIIGRFDKQLEQLKIDGEKISKLNESNADLRELNAGLSQKVQSRDASIIEIKEEVDRVRCELAVCHNLIAAKTNELNKFAGIKPEDPGLRTQLKSLDDTCSRLRANLESETTEVAKYKRDLNGQREVNALNEQKIKELRTQLQQEESKVVDLEIERVQIFKSHTAELEKLRVEINQNFQSRCDEDKYHHTSEITSLQNEKSEAEARHALQLMDIQTQNFEAKKQFAAQLKISKEQNRQLEKEMSEAENLHATQLKDFQAQISEIEQRCSFQVASFQKEKNQLDNEKAEVETHCAAQLASLQTQKDQLEKERSEVETRHAIQLANIQTEKSESEKRYSAQVESFVKEYSHFEKTNAEIETRHAAQLASLNAEKSQLEKEKSDAENHHAAQLAALQIQRSEAEALKSATDAKLSDAENELLRLKRLISQHTETTSSLRTRLDTLELDIKSNTIEIKARDKDVQAIQELCNNKESEIQLLRDEDNQMKADLVVWEKKFTDGEIRSAEFLNDYRAEKKRIGTEAINLALHAESISVTVDELCGVVNSRSTSDSNIRLKEVGRMAPVHKQLAKLKNSTPSSKPRDVEKLTSNQHFIKGVHTNNRGADIQSKSFSHSPSAAKESLSYSGLSYRSNQYHSSTVTKPVQTLSSDLILESQDNKHSMNFALVHRLEVQEDTVSKDYCAQVPASNSSRYTPSQRDSEISQIQQIVGTLPATPTRHNDENKNLTDLNPLLSVTPWMSEVDHSRLKSDDTPEACSFDRQIPRPAPFSSQRETKQATFRHSHGIKRTKSILKSADNNRSMDMSRTHSPDRHAMFELPPTPPVKPAATTYTRQSNMVEASVQAVKHVATTGKKRLGRINHTSQYNRAVGGKHGEVADAYGYSQSQIFDQVVGYGSPIVPNSQRQPIMEAVNQLNIPQGPRIRSTSLKRRLSITLASDPLKGNKRPMY